MLIYLPAVSYEKSMIGRTRVLLLNCIAFSNVDFDKYSFYCEMFALLLLLTQYLCNLVIVAGVCCRVFSVEPCSCIYQW